MCFIKLSNTYSSDKRGHAVFYKMFFYKRNHDAFCNITDIYFKYWISNLTLKKMALYNDCNTLYNRDNYNTRVSTIGSADILYIFYFS